MKRYLDKFEAGFTDSIMLAKGIIENNKCITYMKSNIKSLEEKQKQTEREANEDLALMKANTRKQLSLMEERMEKLGRHETSDRQLIVELSKELEYYKTQSDNVMDGMRENLKDIVTYLAMHSQLISNENTTVMNYIRDDGQTKRYFEEFARNLLNEFKSNLSKMTGELRVCQNSISEQMDEFVRLDKSLKSVDKQQQALVKGEVENFRKSLLNVRNLIKNDTENIENTIVELKLFIDQLGRNTDGVAQDFEKQVNRFRQFNRTLEYK